MQHDGLTRTRQRKHHQRFSILPKSSERLQLKSFFMRGSLLIGPWVSAPVPACSPAAFQRRNLFQCVQEVRCPATNGSLRMTRSLTVQGNAILKREEGAGWCRRKHSCV